MADCEGASSSRGKCRRTIASGVPMHIKQVERNRQLPEKHSLSSRVAVTLALAVMLALAGGWSCISTSQAQQKAPAILNLPADPIPQLPLPTGENADPSKEKKPAPL